MDTGIRSAAADWNSYVGYITSIGSYTEYDDVQISDDNSIDPFLGFTSVYGQDQDSGCYLTLNACDNYCQNSGVMFYTTVKLNFDGPSGGINGTASAWTLGVNQVVEKVMSHEFGHVFDLGDDSGPYSCTSPTIMNNAAPYFCAFSGPQACDVSQMVSDYSGWSVYSFCTTCGCANCGGGACS
jgi:hypothetical protein